MRAETGFIIISTRLAIAQERATMKKLSLLLAPLLFLGLSAAAQADDRPDHYKGKRAETPEQARAYFAEYNAKLAAILAKDTLAPMDMVQVHELTYTLENAIEVLEPSVAGLSESLEEVHQASERLDAGVVKAEGRKYLDAAGKVTR